MASKTTTTFFLLLLLLSAHCNAFQPKFIPRMLPPPDPFCPRDILNFSTCSDILEAANVGSLLAGDALGSKCCILLQGLTSAEAATCLCAVIKESVLRVLTIEWSVAVGLLASSCKKKIPDGFKCI